MNDNNSQWPPSDHVPAIHSNDGVAAHHLAWSRAERARLIDALAAKVEKLKKRFVASAGLNRGGRISEPGKSAIGNI